MAEMRWILSLPAGAEKMHKSENRAVAKRSAEENLRGDNKSVISKPGKRAKIDMDSQKILKSRPILGDILNSQR